MNRKIEILVNPQGQVSVQTLGYHGAGCQQASRFLEEALGARLSQYRTAEFYEQQPVNTPLRENER